VLRRVLIHVRGAHALEVGHVVRRFPVRPRADEVDRAVHRDAVNPGAEVRPRLESTQLLVRLQKRLLHHVLRVRRIAGHPMRQPEDSPAMALDEHPERFAIPASRQRDGGDVRLRHPIA
jgi:hypothetical protein